MSLNLPPFLHRQNPNNTYDSICTKCFATIASNPIELELHDDELRHECCGMHDSSTIQGVNSQMDHLRLHPSSTRTTP